MNQPSCSRVHRSSASTPSLPRLASDRNQSIPFRSNGGSAASSGKNQAWPGAPNPIARIESVRQHPIGIQPVKNSTKASSEVKHYTPAKPGTKMAGYSVLAEIGRGAASIIYLVQDPKTKRIWALKHVEKHSPKDQRFLDQAEAEYEVAQRVRTPTIRHIERMIKGRSKFMSVKELFLLMEYVDGVSLERQPPTTFEQALHIFRETAAALAHMHAVGYVHADMKPNNIVIDETGHVKIIDLGQACPIGTVKERIQGTPDYIAPEQAHLRAITPKTDIYNFGATMYWCVTQRHIPTAMSTGTQSLTGAIDDRFIERATPPHELNSRVPVRLSELIMQCVEVDPARRPASMADVLGTLDEIARSLSQDRPTGVPAGAGAKSASADRDENAA
jgi:serine/threonine protein kinase